MTRLAPGCVLASFAVVCALYKDFEWVTVSASLVVRGAVIQQSPLRMTDMLTCEKRLEVFVSFQALQCNLPVSDLPSREYPSGPRGGGPRGGGPRGGGPRGGGPRGGGPRGGGPRGSSPLGGGPRGGGPLGGWPFGSGGAALDIPSNSKFGGCIPDPVGGAAYKD